MSTPHENPAPDPEPARSREAVGRFAAGVAHDFNNILTATTGFGQLLLMKLASGDPNRKYVERILEACDQAARLTHQLLVLGHKDLGRPEEFDVNAALEQSAPLVRRILEEDLPLELRCAPEALSIRCDRSQFEQILLGLAAFARGTLPKGGRLTIETAPCVLGEAEALRLTGLRPGPHVLLAVSDDGPGMDEDARARAFEPYSARGRERGLALPTVLALVERGSGHIRLESTPGKGNRFEVLLPRVAASLASSTCAALSPETPRGTEVVLVAEDEEPVAALVREVLDSCGYAVRLAAGGEDALRIADEMRTPIDLLLSDVVMPGIDGIDLVRRLRARFPDLPVLLMSGHAGNRLPQAGAEANLPLLPKPFTPLQLARRVREVLDSGRRG